MVDILDATAVAIRAGLLANWPFTADALDHSGNGRNATLHGAVIEACARGHAGAARFAPGQFIETPRIDISSVDFTFATWVKLDSLANRNILYGDWSHPWQFLFAVNSNGVLALNLRKNINSAGSDPNQDLLALVTPEGVVRAGEWCHVAVTWNRSARSATAYVNGVAVISAPTSPPDYADLTLQQNSHPSYFLGRKEDSSDAGSWLSGRLSDFRIYGRALNQAEMLLLVAS